MCVRVCVCACVCVRTFRELQTCTSLLMNFQMQQCNILESTTNNDACVIIVGVNT